MDADTKLMVSWLVGTRRKGAAEELSRGANDLYNNLYTAILRMKDNGAVVKVHGKWGLAKWYPARPKAKAKGQAADKVAEPEAQEEQEEQVDLSELEVG